MRDSFSVLQEGSQSLASSECRSPADYEWNPAGTCDARVCMRLGGLSMNDIRPPALDKPSDMKRCQKCGGLEPGSDRIAARRQGRFEFRARSYGKGRLYSTASKTDPELKGLALSAAHYR